MIFPNFERNIKGGPAFQGLEISSQKSNVADIYKTDDKQLDLLQLDSDRIALQGSKQDAKASHPMSLYSTITQHREQNKKAQTQMSIQCRWFTKRSLTELKLMQTGTQT